MLNVRGLAAVVAFWAGAAGASSIPGWETVYSDDFSYVGAPADPWEVRNGDAYVDGSRMRLQSTSGPRNAMVTAFAGNKRLRNYQLNATVDPMEGGNWTSADIILRADQNAYLGSDGVRGSFYQVEFFNNVGTAANSIKGNGAINFLQISKATDGVGSPSLLQVFIDPLTSPYDLSLMVKGGEISIDINDGQQQFMAIDGVDPLLAGGIGFHTLWEASSYFDNVELVAPIPVPATLMMTLTGLTVLGGVGVRRRRRSHAAT